MGRADGATVYLSNAKIALCIFSAGESIVSAKYAELQGLIKQSLHW